jgi:hypothetical protein
MVMGASQASGKAITLRVANVGAEAVVHGDEGGTLTLRHCRFEFASKRDGCYIGVASPQVVI